MRLPRIKLIWGGAKQAPGHWRLGLWGVVRRELGQPARIAVSLRGALLWLAGLALAGYLAGTTALFFWFGRNPYNLVTWPDTVLLPLRWHQVREKLGRAMITDGLDDLRAKRWAGAYMKLKVGLARSPHDLRARLALAEFLVLANQRTNAIETLSEDLASGYPGRRYLTTLFTTAAQGEDYDAIIAACDRFLPTEKADRFWLVEQKISALNGSDRAAEALQLAEAQGDNVPPLVREGRVLALLALGRSADAISFLDRWAAEPSPDRAQVLRLRARACREAGRLAEMDAALAALRDLEPANPRTLVYKIVQKHLAGQTTAADEALADYVRRFSASPQNLTLAAAALVEAHAPALVQRCVGEAKSHGFRALPFQLLLVQSQLDAGDWPEAARTLVEAKADAKGATEVEQFMLNWLTRLTAVATQADAGPQTALLEIFQERPLPMRMYRQTCETLVKAERYDAARNVLLIGERGFPASRTLGGLRARVERSIAAQQQTVRPEPQVAASVAPGERGFFEQLEADEKAERWSDAAQRLREIRVQKPAWLARREAEVLERQVRVALRTGETLDMLGAATLYLDGQTERAVRVVTLAREFAAAGHKGEGELLVQEVLRKYPNFPPAVRLKKEWEPKP